MRSYEEGCKIIFRPVTNRDKHKGVMPHLINDKTHFADALMRAILAVDAGQADVAVLTLACAGVVKTFTVWGVWDGDVFSWRIDYGTRRKAMPATHGEEVYAGRGDELDATMAAARLCWLCSRLGDGEWSVAI